MRCSTEARAADRPGQLVLRLILAAAAIGMLSVDCGKSSTPSSPTPPPSPTAALSATFGENPVPFRSTGCNASTPQGWFTSVRLQETAGVAFTPRTFTQKLDGSAAAALNESFTSRFAACSGGPLTDGVIPANGTACGTVGICTTDTHASYQFELTGTDANGHAVTFTSPVLQLSPR